jgi:glycerol transport system ATP-binding protein
MTLELAQVARSVAGEVHIHPVSLKPEAGGFNILLGATGAGKTTLPKLMAGLDRPTAGRVLMDGRDVTHDPPQKRGVSFVHQFFINYPTMSVYDNIASPLRVAGVAKAEIDRRVRQAAELLRITPMLSRRPAELSGGQQQRTAIARAIVKEARLVLLDEPLANLDYKLRAELRDQLPALFAGRGATVVYATSEPTEALLLGRHTAALHEGRVTQFGPTPQVYRAPQDVITAAVFSDPPVNIAPVQKARGEFRLPDGTRWPVTGAALRLADGAQTFAVRPHAVSPEPGAGITLRGRVAVTELSGSESVVHFAVGEALARVSQSPGVHPFPLGEVHAYRFDPERGFYFDREGRRVAA